MQKRTFAFCLALGVIGLMIASAAMLDSSVQAQGPDSGNVTPQSTSVPAPTLVMSPAITTPTVISTTTPTPSPIPASPTSVPTTEVLPSATQMPPSATPVPPTQTPLPTATSTLTAMPTSTLTPPEAILKTATDYWFYLTAACIVLFVLSLLVIFLFLRGRGAQAPTTVAQAFLVSVELPKLILPLAKEAVTIGRAKECDLQITEKMKLTGADSISRVHARLEKRGERWVLIDGAPDQPSTNGVFVNGVRTRENYLRDGVEIRLGQVTFQFYTQLPETNPAQGGAR